MAAIKNNFGLLFCSSVEPVTKARVQGKADCNRIDVTYRSVWFFRQLFPAKRVVLGDIFRALYFWLNNCTYEVSRVQTRNVQIF